MRICNPNVVIITIRDYLYYMRSTYHIKQEIEERKLQIADEKKSITALCEERKLQIRSFSHDDKMKMDAARERINALNLEIEQLNEELKTKESNYNYNNTEQQMEKRSFSLLNTIKNVVENRAHDALTDKILHEGAAAATRSALNPSGQIQLPLETRNLTVADEGNDVVSTDMFNLVERLREESTLSKLGVTFMSGLVGNIQFPKLGALNAATWDGEVSPTADSTVNLDSIKVEPFRLSVILPISKQLLMQSDNIGLEKHLRNEIVNAISEKIEATYFGNAAKTATSPAGLFAPSATVTSCEKFEDLCTLESALEENHVKDYQYVISPKAKAAMRAMPKSAKTNELVLQNNEVDGRNAVTSTYLDDKNFVIGSFKDTYVCFWGPGLDVLVDNVTLSHEGKTRLVANVYVNFVNVRPESLVCGKIGK